MQPSEVTLSGFPASASAEPLPVQSMAQLVAVLELQRHHPVISLRQALEQMGYVNAATLDRIQAEDAEYLRSQSGELVRRMLLTAEDLEHALARMQNGPDGFCLEGLGDRHKGRRAPSPFRLAFSGGDRRAHRFQPRNSFIHGRFRLRASRRRC